MHASIAIVAHNETANIQGVLRSVFQQFGLKEYVGEIILLDNASTDDTITKAEAMVQESPVPLRIIPLPENNLGKARTRAIHECAHCYLAFTDADCILPRNWFVSIYQSVCTLREQDDRTAGICTGNILPENSQLGRLVGLMHSNILGHGYSPQAMLAEQMRTVDHLPTTSCILYLPIVRKVGNFSEDFRHVGEDLELGSRLRKFGYKMFFLPEVIVDNNSAGNLIEWLRRMFYFGRAQTQVFLLHPDSFRKVRMLPGFVIVACSLLLLLSPIFAIQAAAFLFCVFLMNATLVCVKNNQERNILPLCLLTTLSLFAYGSGELYQFIRLLRPRQLAQRLFVERGSKPVAARAGS